MHKRIQSSHSLHFGLDQVDGYRGDTLHLGTRQGSTRIGPQKGSDFSLARRRSNYVIPSRPRWTLKLIAHHSSCSRALLYCRLTEPASGLASCTGPVFLKLGVFTVPFLFNPSLPPNHCILAIEAARESGAQQTHSTHTYHTRQYAHEPLNYHTNIQRTTEAR